jgi:hypothetical protein
MIFNYDICLGTLKNIPGILALQERAKSSRTL